MDDFYEIFRCNICSICRIVFLIPDAFAQVQPGDACSVTDATTQVGGPDNPGGGYSLVCDGSNWKTVSEWRTSTGNSLFQVGYDTGACLATKVGRLRYDSAGDAWEYCNGSAWLPFEHAAGGGLAGPAGCENIGDQCPDTTIFAGYHPFTHDHLFIGPTDQGGNHRWKTATGTDDIANDSFIDGRINMGQVAADTTVFPAFKACNDLTLAGKDWFLPSRTELDYLYNNRANYLAKAPGNGFEDFQNAYYWSSSEYSTSASWYQIFTNGYMHNINKANAYRVRCMAR